MYPGISVIAEGGGSGPVRGRINESYVAYRKTLQVIGQSKKIFEGQASDAHRDRRSSRSE